MRPRTTIRARWGDLEVAVDMTQTPSPMTPEKRPAFEAAYPERAWPDGDYVRAYVFERFPSKLTGKLGGASRALPLSELTLT